jgi:uncharacterized membrane protein
MSQHLAIPRPSSRTAARSSATNASLLAAAADAPLGVVVDHPPKLACEHHPEAVDVDMDDSSSSSMSSSSSSSNEEDSSARTGRKRFQRLLLPEGAGQPDRAAGLDVSDGDAPAPVPSCQDRVRSIDLLRGWGVVVMVLVHFMVFYGNEAAMESILYFALSDLIGNGGAAGFLALAGMSHALAVGGRFRKAAAASGRPWTERDEFRHARSRALKLQGAELLMLALAWGPRGMIKWNILTLQAASTLVLHACRRLPSEIVAMVAAGIALATPALRAWLVEDFASAWGSGFRMSPFAEKFAPGLVYDPVACDIEVRWDVTSVWQSYVLTGIFPLFPWLVFPLVGHILGRRMLTNQFQHDVPGVLVLGKTSMVLGMGAALYSCSRPHANVVTDYLSPLSFYPDSFTMILIQLGFVLVMISLTYRHYDVKHKLSTTASNTRDGPEEPILHRVFYLTSRWALPIYCLHYILLAWPLAARYYLWDGTYPMCDWMEASSALLAGLVALACLLGLAVLFENGCQVRLHLPMTHRFCHSRRQNHRSQQSELRGLEVVS